MEPQVQEEVVYFFCLFKTFWMIKVSTGANTVRCVSLDASAESASVTEVA